MTGTIFLEMTHKEFIREYLPNSKGTSIYATKVTKIAAENFGGNYAMVVWSVSKETDGTHTIRNGKKFGDIVGYLITERHHDSDQDITVKNAEIVLV